MNNGSGRGAEMEWLHPEGYGKGIQGMDSDPVMLAAKALNERVKRVTLHELSPALSGYGDAVNQLQRSALSVWLNIAEGNGRMSPRGSNQYWRVALGSCYETYACMQMLEFTDDDLRLCTETALLLEAEYLANGTDFAVEETARFMDHYGGHREP